MRSHGARCRRGSSWPTTTSTRARRPRAASCRGRACGPASRRPAASAGSGSSALTGSVGGEQAADRREAEPRGRRRGGDARERSEQRTIDACRRTLGGRRAARGGEMAGERPRCSRLCSAGARSAQCLHVDAGLHGAAPRPNTRLAMLNRLTDTLDFQGQALDAALGAPAPDRQQHRQRRHAGLRRPRHEFRAGPAQAATGSAAGGRRAGHQPRRATSARGAAGARGQGRRRAALRDRRRRPTSTATPSTWTASAPASPTTRSSTRRRCASSTATCARSLSAITGQ